ncbi:MULTISPECIES: LacI family DNA-binding transcriptional regulator [Streptomyces]|uniref:LacI family transcriptional regulator n=1 Tax=Streptomyces yangpuensis TaxID=1648182 RepID=A0ABY5Q4M0_9ACTN|nr:MULTISPECIES: LacI family DNA-binding transcriptional regulator [Streptomyces]MBZ9599653.1 LacI family transcriptional regulator [Streptomyces erythrochromogenes]UUY51214.1 LacI family transcriptional regulator [Streptomyces yangpuensis]
MNARTVTLLDVARAAGVSKSTVSDALQGSGRVAEATRDRVHEVAERLGYRPNSAARRLRRASTGAVGLYLPQTATRLDYYMNLAFGAVARAQEEGLDVVLLAAAAGGPGRFASRVDGLLVIDPEVGDPAVPALLDAGVPVVTGERYLGPAPAPTGAVVCDNSASLTALLDHVRARGARRPALLAPADTSAWAAALHATAGSWGAEHGTPVAIHPVPFAATADEAERAALALLAAEPATDAVICAPDGAAPGVLRAAAVLGRTVGADFLVASCVDGTATRSSSPPITAVDLRPAAYGRACVDLLCDILAGRTPADTVRRHEWTLRTRASTLREG